MSFAIKRHLPRALVHETLPAIALLGPAPQWERVVEVLFPPGDGSNCYLHDLFLHKLLQHETWMNLTPLGFYHLVTAQGVSNKYLIVGESLT